MSRSSNTLRRAEGDEPDAGGAALTRAALPVGSPPVAPATAPLETAIALRVWDPALRLFHWLLAVTVAGAIASGEIGGPWIEWHGRLGLMIGGLLGFRLAWGVLGPETARFASFVRGPAAIRSYLQGRWQGIGHNPLGALAVIALLLLGVLQVATGAVSNDDIDFQGPLAGLVSGSWSNRASGLHQKLSWLLIGMVVIHLLAIVWYRLVRKDDLIRPMLSGERHQPPGTFDAAARDAKHAPAAFGYLSLMASIAIGAATAALLSGSLLGAASPTAAVSPAGAAQAPAQPAW